MPEFLPDVWNYTQPPPPENFTVIHTHGFADFMANNSMASMGSMGLGDWNVTDPTNPANGTFTHVSVPGMEHGLYGTFVHMNETDWFHDNYNMTATMPIPVNYTDYFDSSGSGMYGGR